jgi:hypothetical protein
VIALDSKETRVKQRAAAKLVYHGELALPALRELLDKRQPFDTRPMAEALLEIISTQPRPPEIQRALRGVEILERLGTPDARQVLQRLAAGARGHALTCTAEAALMRLGQR